MAKSVISPHDKVFRQSMSQPGIAQDFFHYHLPDWIKEMATLSELKLKPGSFVDNKLKAFYTDLLYEVPVDGHPGYLFLLAEHKSFASKFLPLQLLEYMSQIWRQHIKEHGESGHRVSEGKRPRLPTEPCVRGRTRLIKIDIPNDSRQPSVSFVG